METVEALGLFRAVGAQDQVEEGGFLLLQLLLADRLYEKLRETLPEEGQATLLAYGEALGAAHYLEVAMLAERAFLDGVRMILRALGAGSGDGS